MKTITLLLLAALSAQLPGSDTLATAGGKARVCVGQKGPPHPSAEDGRYSPLTSQRPTI